MTFSSALIANTLALAGLLIGANTWAAGLPSAGYRPLKLPAFSNMEAGRVDGTVDSMDDMILMVISEDGTGYTVDTGSAKFVNAFGKKAKRETVQIGDRVVVDGYFAKNSTAMLARRVIDAGMAIQP